jgi:general secretion pathway protein K
MKLMPTSIRRRNNNRGQRGGALLAVLWLSAALSAIAFSVASHVRAETERASTLSESIRAGYLASGAIEGAILKIQSARNGGRPSPPRFRYSFATGEAVVEVIPETARLDINRANQPDLANLLLALGAEPQRAQAIAAAILDWRAPGGQFDDYYLRLTPSFRPRHASFQEIDEAIWVRGMTADLFHGSYTRDARSGRLVRLGAFKDCVSVFGEIEKFDANGIEPALLRSFGASFDGAAAFVAEREKLPLANAGELARVAPMAGMAMARLSVSGNSIYTLRATARVRLPDNRLSDVSRTVSAQVKFRLPDYPPAYQVLRWDDQAFSPSYSEARAWR